MDRQAGVLHFNIVEGLAYRYLDYALHTRLYCDIIRSVVTVISCRLRADFTRDRDLPVGFFRGRQISTGKGCMIR